MNVAKFGIFSKFHQLCFLLAKGKLILNYPTPYERSNLSSWWWRSGRRITQSRIPINHQPSLFCRLLVLKTPSCESKKMYHPSHVERTSQEVTGFLQNLGKTKRNVATTPETHSVCQRFMSSGFSTSTKTGDA